MTAIRSVHDCPVHGIPLVLNENWAGFVAWYCPRCEARAERRDQWKLALILGLLLVVCMVGEGLWGVR